MGIGILGMKKWLKRFWVFGQKQDGLHGIIYT